MQWDALSQNSCTTGQKARSSVCCYWCQKTKVLFSKKLPSAWLTRTEADAYNLQSPKLRVRRSWRRGGTRRQDSDRVTWSPPAEGRDLVPASPAEDTRHPRRWSVDPEPATKSADHHTTSLLDRPITAASDDGVCRWHAAKLWQTHAVK